MRTRLPAIVLLLAAALPAQEPPLGYRGKVAPLPSGASNPLVLPDASVVYFTGTELIRDTSGQKKTLLRFQTPVFGSFTKSLGTLGLLFGESSNGDVWVVDPDGVNAPRNLATIPFNYDALLHRAGFAVVSAKVGGFSSPDNDVYMLDLRSGATDLLARLPGASGPLATMAEDGILLYATASASFPPPPGSSDVISFTEAQVLSAVGPTWLTQKDAKLVAKGFDSAGALATDDDRDIFLADWQNARIHEIDDLGAATKLFMDLKSASLSPGGLQFMRETTRLAPVFEPFQSAFNRLLVFEYDASFNLQIRTVTALRPAPQPSAQNPIPRGPFRIDLKGGPGKGFAVFFLMVPPRGGIMDSYFAVPGFEFPFFWAIDFTTPWIGIPVGLDGSGFGSLALDNPGFVESLDVQAFLIDARGSAAGTSSFEVLGFARS